MVDTKKSKIEQFQATLDLFDEPTEGCDEEIALGIQTLRFSLTLSHSLTSRRYSISGLLRKHVDAPVAEFLSKIDLVPLRKLLGDFIPSKMFQRLPAFSVNRNAYSIAKAAEPVPSIEDYFSGKQAQHFGTFPASESIQVNRRNRAVLACLSVSDSAASMLERWDSNLRYARHVVSENYEQLRDRDLHSISESVESLRSLVSALRFVRTGGYTKDAVYGESCELCWRRTMKAKIAQSSSGRLSERVHGSARFCHKHQPGKPGSLYRTDLRYKSAFQSELRARFPSVKSRYVFKILAAPEADTEEIRKRAYLQVHSKLERKRAWTGEFGTREVAYFLKIQGLNQSEIGRKMGISRQAVSKALKDVRCRIIPVCDVARYSDSFTLAEQQKRLGLSDAELSRLID